MIDTVIGWNCRALAELILAFYLKLDCLDQHRQHINNTRHNTTNTTSTTKINLAILNACSISGDRIPSLVGKLIFTVMRPSADLLSKDPSGCFIRQHPVKSRARAERHYFTDPASRDGVNDGMMWSWEMCCEFESR
jgi:hypothetical protein